MYYAFIENEKINGAGQCKCLSDGVENIEISQEVYNNISAYVYKTGAIVPDKEHTVEKEEVRAVRNQYLETYVDPKQLVMVWNSLTAEEQELYKNYRQYLLDYPQTEGWYEENPLTFEEWKNPPVEELVAEENENASEIPDADTSVSIDNTYL